MADKVRAFVDIKDGECPICGHCKIVMLEMDISSYEIDMDGYMISHKTEENRVRAFCEMCTNEVKPIRVGPFKFRFVPKRDCISKDNNTNVISNLKPAPINPFMRKGECL